jgi:hypothetical protein
MFSAYVIRENKSKPEGDKNFPVMNSPPLKKILPKIINGKNKIKNKSKPEGDKNFQIFPPGLSR